MEEDGPLSQLLKLSVDIGSEQAKGFLGEYHPRPRTQGRV
jgi:hypothetical protein